jgi:hypothetical protein
MTIYNCRVRGLYAGAFRWSYGFHIGSTASAATVLSTLHDATNTFWTTATNGYKNLVNADVTVTQVAVYTLNSSLITLAVTTTPLAVTGSNSHDSLPFNISVVMGLRGDSDIKSDRGSLRLPTPSNDAVTGHVLTTGFLASLKLVADPFWVSMRALSGYQLNIYNRKTNKQGDPPFTAHPINSYVVSNKPGTARERVRKILPTASVVGTV